MQFNISEWLAKKKKGEVILAHSGELTSNIITLLLADLESGLEKYNISSKAWKKVYNVAVESLQNLFHHADATPSCEADEHSRRFSAFILVREGNIFKAITGNFVREPKVKKLKDRVDQINFLTKVELKALYKLILNNQEFSEKGGGGLGMIDIARRTGSKLDYVFYDYDKDYNFFSLEVLI